MKNPFLENFKPYIPDSADLRELSVFPLIVGTLLGIIFGASSLYLVLKTGLTVSASIPSSGHRDNAFPLDVENGFA
jgi:hypothetical protein